MREIGYSEQLICTIQDCLERDESRRSSLKDIEDFLAPYQDNIRKGQHTFGYNHDNNLPDPLAPKLDTPLQNPNRNSSNYNSVPSQQHYSNYNSGVHQVTAVPERSYHSNQGQPQYISGGQQPHYGSTSQHITPARYSNVTPSQSMNRGSYSGGHNILGGIGTGQTQSYTPGSGSYRAY